jgi:hypothetical protein
VPDCSHLDSIDTRVVPGAAGCEDCLREGSSWVHLRVCQSCGHVGCCDSSPRRHATAHHHESGHPVVRSFEPGEDWFWCYPDEVVFKLADAPPAPSHTDEDLGR